MRVIAGEFRSRRLLSVPGIETRPTSDRLRETLFNILGNAVENSLFVDGYAGTGAIGIEALSRGARAAVFIEKDRKALEILQKNLETLGITARSRVIQGSAHLYLRGTEGDIVFLDPPYTKEREYTASLDVLSAQPPKLTVVQHSIRLKLEDSYGPLRRTRVVRQGDNALSFYRPEPA
jgi:16S rRNA (guanine(966)-N(2))-methyltransferase RsmD